MVYERLFSGVIQIGIHVTEVQSLQVMSANHACNTKKSLITRPESQLEKTFQSESHSCGLPPTVLPASSRISPLRSPKRPRIWANNSPDTLSNEVKKSRYADMYLVSAISSKSSSRGINSTQRLYLDFENREHSTLQS